MQKDIAYVVLSPDEDALLLDLYSYLRDMSQVYEVCRLGKHFALQLPNAHPHLNPAVDHSAGIYSFPFASGATAAPAAGPSVSVNPFSSSSSSSCSPPTEADASAIPESILSGSVFAALPASIREFISGIGRCFNSVLGAPLLPFFSAPFSFVLFAFLSLLPVCHMCVDLSVSSTRYISNRDLLAFKSTLEC